MEKQSFKVSKVNNIILFLIYPILSLPVIIRGAVRNKRYSYILLSIFMGYIGLLYAPIGDYYRYYTDFNNYKPLNLQEMLEVLQYSNDYLMPIVYWCIAKVGMSADLTRFIYNCTGFLLYFKIFYNLTSGTNNIAVRKVLLFIFVLIIGYQPFMSRFGLATIFFVYGAMCILNRKQKGWLWLMLASIQHFSFVALLIPFVVFNIIKYEGSKNISVILVILSFIFNNDFISPILSMIADSVPIVNHISYYVDGYYANDYYEEHSIRFQILYILSQVGYYSLLMFFCVFFTKTRLSGWINFLLILIVISSPFKGISIRFIGVTQYFLIIYFINFIIKYGFPKVYLRNLFIAMSCFMLVINLWSTRRELSMSMESKLLLPSIFIWTSEYSPEWVDNNVNTDGSPKMH